MASPRSMPRQVERAQRNLDPPHVPRHPRRLAEEQRHGHVDGRIAEEGVVQVQVLGLAWPRRPRRRGSARARRWPQTPRGARRRWPGRSAPAPRCTRSPSATCRGRRWERRAARSAHRARRRGPAPGRALESPPAPTSWMNRMGLASPRAQQRSMTSWQRRCISGLSRCTEAKSRSSAEAPLAMLEAAPPPRPMSMAGPPRTTRACPPGRGSFRCPRHGCCPCRRPA